MTPAHVLLALLVAASGASPSWPPGLPLAYAIWGRLLRRYPAATVTPFALLVPFVAAFGSSLAFGERFGPLRLLGMGLVLLGLAVIVTARRRCAIIGAHAE